MCRHPLPVLAFLRAGRSTQVAHMHNIECMCGIWAAHLHGGPEVPISTTPRAHAQGRQKRTLAAPEGAPGPLHNSARGPGLGGWLHAIAMLPLGPALGFLAALAIF